MIDWYIGAIVLGALVALMALYHDEVSRPFPQLDMLDTDDQIVTWLKPAANWMKKCVSFTRPSLAWR